MRQPAAFTLTNLLRRGRRDANGVTRLRRPTLSPLFLSVAFSLSLSSSLRVARLSLVSRVIGHFYANRSSHRRRRRLRRLRRPRSLHRRHPSNRAPFPPFRGLTLRIARTPFFVRPLLTLGRTYSSLADTKVIKSTRI